MARLKDLAGIEGLRRGKKRKTTKADAAASRHPDLVERTSVAAAPNSLWVSDLTYVATWSGFAYVYFITDAFSRMIVGWRVASHMKTDMVLDALEMARWRRDTTLEGLISHTDAGSQFTSIRYGEKLADLGAVPSIGSVGDAFDNALAESVNAAYKSELIRGPGHWSVEDRRRRGTGHPRLGALVQHRAPPRVSRLRYADRVRGGLCRRESQPGTGWSHIAGVSIRPRTVHFRRFPSHSPQYSIHYLGETPGVLTDSLEVR